MVGSASRLEKRERKDLAASRQSPRLDAISRRERVFEEDCGDSKGREGGVPWPEGG